MSTAPTVESCRALGLIHGSTIARRHLAAMLPKTIEEGVLQTEAEKEARVKAGGDEEHADCLARQTELAMRGATLPALEAYTAGRREAYAAEVDIFCAKVAEIEAGMPPLPNRKARLKAKALARKAPAP